MHKFSDFAEENPLEGEKISLLELLNKEVEVLAYRLSESKQKSGTQCLTLQVRYNGKLRVLFTGSAVLISQVLKYTEQLPFEAKIKKINNYFTFA